VTAPRRVTGSRSNDEPVKSTSMQLLIESPGTMFVVSNMADAALSPSSTSSTVPAAQLSGGSPVVSVKVAPEVRFTRALTSSRDSRQLSPGCVGW